MRHLNKSSEKDYITFDNDNEDINKISYNKFENFEEAEKKINESLTKNKSQYSDMPIRITIHSYHCIDGIIIDLPGFPEKGKINYSIK